MHPVVSPPTVSVRPWSALRTRPLIVAGSAGKAWTAANRCELRDAALRTAPPPDLYAWARPPAPPDARRFPACRAPRNLPPAEWTETSETRAGVSGSAAADPPGTRTAPRCRRRSGLDVPRWRGVPPAIVGFRDGSLFRVGRRHFSAAAGPMAASFPWTVRAVIVQVRFPARTCCRRCLPPWPRRRLRVKLCARL